jgi:hypothetical protein
MIDKEELWDVAFALAREAESEASELRETLGQPHTLNSRRPTSGA